MLRFTTQKHGDVAVTPTRLLIAGWTGRDPAAVQHHIDELAALGVAPPSTTPLFYGAPASLVTQETEIQVLGEETSGEVEPVLVDDGERLWLTVGSDHTDRGLEAHSVAHSKAICAKPVARDAVPLTDVIDGADDLRLQSWIQEVDAGPDAAWVPYQDATLAALRPLRDLIGLAPGGNSEALRLGAGTVMFCGTAPVLSGGVRPAQAMRLSLMAGRLDLPYRVNTQPVVQ